MAPCEHVKASCSESGAREDKAFVWPDVFTQVGAAPTVGMERVDEAKVAEAAPPA